MASMGVDSLGADLLGGTPAPPLIDLSRITAPEWNINEGSSVQRNTLTNRRE
jgi:hypothetical protein